MAIGLMIILSVFSRVSKRMLANQQRVMVGLVDDSGSRQLVQLDHVLFDPATPGPLVDQFALDLAVVDDAALLHVDRGRSCPAASRHFLAMRSGSIGKHADFAGHDDQVILGDVIAAGTQAIAIQHRADLFAIGKRDRCRAVPWLHQAGVVFVERLEVRLHQLMLLPGLGDEHQHRVGDRSPAE